MGNRKLAAPDSRPGGHGGVGADCGIESKFGRAGRVAPRLILEIGSVDDVPNDMMRLTNPQNDVAASVVPVAVSIGIHVGAVMRVLLKVPPVARVHRVKAPGRVGPVTNTLVPTGDTTAAPSRHGGIQAGAVAGPIRVGPVAVRAATCASPVLAVPELASRDDPSALKPDGRVGHLVDPGVARLPGRTSVPGVAGRGVLWVAVTTVGPAGPSPADATANHGPAAAVERHVAVRLPDLAANFEPIKPARAAHVTEDIAVPSDGRGLGEAGEADADGVRRRGCSLTGEVAHGRAVGDGVTNSVRERVECRRLPLGGGADRDRGALPI